MKTKTAWIVGILVGLVVLLALPVGYLMGRLLPWTRYSMMDGSRMMDWGLRSMHPLSGGVMLLGWLIPAGIVALLVIGVVALVNTLSRPKHTEMPPAPPVIERSCGECGKPAQAEWNTCPYCGKPLG